MQDMVADINATGIDNKVALHFAAEGGHLDIINEILARDDVTIDAASNSKRTPLHAAAIKGDVAIAKALVIKGADPNYKDFDESTPLHLASEFGHKDIVQYLVQ